MPIPPSSPSPSSAVSASRVQELLLQAADLFRMRRFDEAADFYRQVLRLDPNQSLALEMLAVLMGSAGRTEEAIGLLQRAVAVDGKSPETFKNLAVLLHNSGQHADSEAAARRALALHAEYAEGYFVLGNALLSQSRLEEAIEAYRQTVARTPNFIPAYINLGGAYRAQRKLEEAITAARRVVELDPNNAQAYSNLGSLLRDVEKFDEAIAAYKKAIELDPNYADAHQNLGNLLENRGRHAEAVTCFERVRVLRPGAVAPGLQLGIALQAQGRMDEAVQVFQRLIAQGDASADVYCQLGAALQGLNRIDEAEQHYRKALEREPNHAGAWNNLGFVQATRGRLEEAIVCYRKAVAIKPDAAEVYNNLGNVYRDLSRIPEALQAFQKSIFFLPDSKDAHWNRSLTLLTAGEFREGWREYEWRWLRFPDRRRGLPQPLWDGSPFEGKTVLLVSEQGFGDTLQFIRYAPLVKQRGGRVLLECEYELRDVLRSVPGIDAIYARGETLPAFDFQIPLLTLPAVFETTLETIPQNVPYLRADMARFTPLLEEEASHGALKVGLAWAGRPTHANDQNRSIPIASLAHWGKIKNVAFYSLQKWKPRTQWGSSAEGLTLIDYTASLQTFADTAALMAKLDLVLAVDTSIVHLAGALGRPTWVMLPYASDWRWLLERTDTPWYPTMRLFRQETPGDWTSVIAAVTEALEQQVKAR